MQSREFLSYVRTTDTFISYLGWVQVLRREKIKVEYRTSHLSKIVGTLSPPTDFHLPSQVVMAVKIIRSNIEYIYISSLGGYVLTGYVSSRVRNE